MYEYEGFTAKIWKDGANWCGVIYGLDIRFEADTEESAVEIFHRIADEHMPEPD